MSTSRVTSIKAKVNTTHRNSAAYMSERYCPARQHRLSSLDDTFPPAFHPVNTYFSGCDWRTHGKSLEELARGSSTCIGSDSMVLLIQMMICWTPAQKESIRESQKRKSEGSESKEERGRGREGGSVYYHCAMWRTKPPLTSASVVISVSVNSRRRHGRATLVNSFNLPSRLHPQTS